MNPKIKNIIIFGGIFILLVAGYVIFFGKKTSTPALQTTSGIPTTASSASPVGSAGVGKEFLDTLLNIRNIKLDASIFSNPAFISLNDFDLSLIQEQNPGRKNPFLPLGTDSQPSPTPAASPSPQSANPQGGPSNP